MPFEMRLPALFVLGACVGSLVNLGTYALAWHPRPIGPWSRPARGVPPRRPFDRLPILGWLGLRREAGVHGRGFWIRPLAVELLCGAGFAALYWWEIGQRGLLPTAISQAAPPGLLTVLHAQYAAHLLLISLMLVASLIDIDEKTIPDTITVPGTLLGLAVAAAYPWSLLPDVVVLPGGVLFDFLQLTSPNPWPAELEGFPRIGSLALGLGCWWTWCAALLPRTWYARHGRRRAVQLLLARLARDRTTYRLLLVALVGSAAMAAVWFPGGSRWCGLLSALVGMAAGGGLIWAVRVVASAVLRREAMGFGDVTLMAMVGSFLGWQSCLMIFFLAPLAGLVVGVVQLILVRRTKIPYGPFLCLAATVLIVRWASFWDWAWGLFALGWLVPIIVLACVALMGLLLGLWRLILGMFR